MMRLFANEPRGQFTPCRAGGVQAANLPAQAKGDEDLLEALLQAIADTSICGLGQAAPKSVRRGMRHFRLEVLAGGNA